MAIVAHPDDEVLSCGAALAEHALRGDVVTIMILAGGEPLPPRKMDVRVKEAERAADFLIGASRKPGQGPFFGMGAEQRLQFEPEIATSLIKSIEAHNPQIIYTHRPAEINSDHRAVYEIVRVATRPWGARRRPLKILAGLVDPMSLHSLRMNELNVYRAVSRVAVDRKLDALRAYDSEFPKDQYHPRHPRTVDFQMRVWGSAIGVEHAEAFELLLEVN